MKNKKQFFGVLISVFVSVFVVALIVYAVTTISEDVDIDTGKLVAGHDAILEHALQVGHTASAAYSRFGNATTGHSLADDDDVLFVGLVEFDNDVYFDGFASIAEDAYLRVPIIYGAVDAGQYLRIGDANTTGHALDSEDDLLVSGELEVDGTAYFDGIVSISVSTGSLIVPTIYGGMDNNYLRIGDINTTGHSLGDIEDLLITGELEVDDTAWFDGIVSISTDLWVDRIYGTLGAGYLSIGDANTTGHALDSEDDLLITGDFEVDGTAYFDGITSISNNLWVETIYGALSDTYLRIGDGGDSTTSHSFTSEDDLLITGNLEVDGTSWFDGKIRAGQFGDPIDVTSARKYGTELHYRGNNYDVVGLRSRASLRDTDASTKSAWGAEIQGANDDGIDASVVQGAVIEGIGKSDTTTATITTLRGAVINTEWAAQDTVTDLRTLHVRTHTMNSDTAGYISNTGYLLYLENEAVGGNGQQLDAGIYLKATNVSTPSAFNYGIDLSGAANEIATADLRLSSSTTISSGASRPATCVKGSLFMDTTAGTLNVCLATNDWGTVTVTND